MPRNVFQYINSSNLGWHLDLAKGEEAKDYSEWFWAEGELKNGYQYSVGFFTSTPPNMELTTPDKVAFPYIQIFFHAPDGINYKASDTFPKEAFKPDVFGVAIRNNVFDGKINENGLPVSYTMKMSLDNLELDVTAKVIATGIKFNDSKLGYSYYHPKKNIALGRWPLVPRAEISATLKIDGKSISSKGLGYLERQVMNMPNAFGGGGQHMWYWGHLFGDDYTAVWTDSAASDNRNFKHFAPFVLYKGSHVVFSSFNLACCTEQWVYDASGKLYPSVVSMRASDGVKDVNVQLWKGETSAVHEIANPVHPDKRGRYTRQYCDITRQISSWDDLTEVKGKAIHEFGGGEYWDPSL